MPQFYVVKGIGGGFDGLVVEAFATQEGSLVEVLRIIDRNSIVGDRAVALPIPGQAIYLDKRFLEETDDPTTREFAANNPFGNLVLEGHMEMGDLKVSYAQFESVISVNIREPKTGKTLFSQYFSKDFDKVKQTIEAVLKESGGSDAEDLVFQLRALKEAEANG